MVKVLFLASNPEGTSSLKLDEEIRMITQKVRASEYRDVLKLESLFAVRPDDLLQALNEHQPQIVHFSGHGSAAGEIILMDRNRQVKPVSADALRALFTTLKDNIRVVVLNACYSQLQAAAIAEVIDCVVGMNKAVGDYAAITFAASFYRAIGFGRSVAEAFEQGKTAILLEGISEADTPQLLTRQGVDPAAVFLIGGAPQPAPKHALAGIIALDIQQKRRLIDGLLACDSVRDRDTRNTIVDGLPEQIRSTIKRHSADLVDVANIVDRCLAFSGGLAALVEHVRFYERDSQPMRQVDDLLSQFGFAPI
jgi:hypothetical protein